MNIVQEWILYRKLKPLLKQLQEVMSMPLSWSRFFQILAVLLQILNLVLPVVPPKYKPYVLTVIGIVQVILHNAAGNVNPDGTPATTVYVPK